MTTCIVSVFEKPSWRTVLTTKDRRRLFISPGRSETRCGPKRSRQEAKTENGRHLLGGGPGWGKGAGQAEQVRHLNNLTDGPLAPMVLSRKQGRTPVDPAMGTADAHMAVSRPLSLTLDFSTGDFEGPGVVSRYALAFDIFVLESSKLRQARLIEHAHLALAEFEKLALAQFPQHSIDMYRSEAESVRQIVLGERAFKAVLGNRAGPFQTRLQFEEEMRCPRQCAASSYIGEMLSDNRSVVHEGFENKGEEMGRLHGSKGKCLGRSHQHRKFGLSHKRFKGAARVRLRQDDIASQCKIQDLSLPAGEFMGSTAPARLDYEHAIAVLALIDDDRLRQIALRRESQRLDKRRIVVVKSDIRWTIFIPARKRM